jgi:ABC-2 type transport system ATP-binding protein
MSGAAAVEAVGVCKSFGGKLVLDGIDLDITAGSVFALLGPNWAGKTTMVRVLSTLIPADSGQMRVAGHDVTSDPDGVRGAIGVTGQFSALDELFSGAQNLRLMADLNHLGRREGARRVGELLERFDLSDAASKAVSTYSGGMRRRLDLAMTLVGSPQVIFLDEPTTGLDPRGRRMMWQSIHDLAAGGTTIFLTTQYLDEADQLSDRIGSRSWTAAASSPKAPPVSSNAAFPAATSDCTSPTPTSSTRPPACSGSPLSSETSSSSRCPATAPPRRSAAC